MVEIIYSLKWERERERLARAMSFICLILISKAQLVHAS